MMGAVLNSVLIIFILLAINSTAAQIYINEVADKGSENWCEGEDWVELFNSGSDEILLSGFILHDDKGPDDSRAFQFNESAAIFSKNYLVLCCNGDKTSNSLEFKIGGDDTITLIDGSSTLLSTTGTLPDIGKKGCTYARDLHGKYLQTCAPTPGRANEFRNATVGNKNLDAQNAEGSSFFGMDGKGLHVPGFDSVVDLHAEIDDEDWANLKSNSYAETYVPVKEFKVITSNNEYVLLSPGRMRPRGQSTLFFPICMNVDSIPFKLDFASSNASQTLFGVETAYLRTHLGDSSKMREWVMHRMLANFGLPYVRCRHVRFYVNGEQLGFYTFMEAIDQEYVSSRSFGESFDLENNALYKVKSLSIACGNENEYNKGAVEGYSDKCTSYGNDCCADDSWGEPKTCAPGYNVKELSQPCMYTCMSNSGENPTLEGPYQFERGEHREDVLHKSDINLCDADFWSRFYKERMSVVKAFYNYGFKSEDDCGEFLISQGLIDRDMGTSEWDSSMKAFINSHLSVKGKCRKDMQCSNKKNIADVIDVDNWLKNFAVYSVTVVQDSPMGNGNNYFLAAAGDGNLEFPKWKMIPYDHNNNEDVAAFLCDEQCSGKDLTDWSVIRPTCRHLEENQLVGPLLLNTTLHKRYIEFVRQFVEEVYTNQNLLSHIQEHAQSIKASANASPYSSFYGEMNSDALSKWMEVRAGKVLSQLNLWEKGDFPAIASIDSSVPCATRNDEFCSSSWCTSPDGNGGYDCWAGSSEESCTCSSGKAKETGNNVIYGGITYYQYVCCNDGTGEGEVCGDYSSSKVILGVLIFISTIILVFLVLLIKSKRLKYVETKRDPKHNGLS